MSQITPSRTALITGASRGIGRAIAVAMGTRHFKVVVNYLGNLEAAHETVALVEQAGGSAIAVQADIGRAEDRQRLVDESLKAFGTIHVHINNAGIPPARRDDLLDADEAIYDRVMDTNLKGPFFLTQLVAKEMVKGVGCGVWGVGEKTSAVESSTPNPKPHTPHPDFIIININSISAYAVSVHRSQYCIAKAGMSMMTQLFAARLAAQGINVYEIRPGIIDTDMARNAKSKYDALINGGDMLPIARWGQPEDVAKAVGAIVDGALPYSTGAVIDVDGGYHIRRL